jgi:hypothetical protein
VLSGGLAKLFLEDCFLSFTKGTIVKIEFPELDLAATAQTKFKINRVFYVGAPNMQFVLTAVLTIKEKEKYKQEAFKASVNLRGQHYKINQEFSLKVNFEGSLRLVGSCTVFSNKFTSIPSGHMKLSEVKFRGVKLDRFEIGFVPHPMVKAEEVDYQVKKAGNEVAGISNEFTTGDLLNGLFL